MSKERDFHKLIESQDREQKDAIWKKIENRIGREIECDNVETDGEVLVCSKNRTDNFKRNILIIVSVFLALALAVCLIFLLVRKPAPSDGVIDDPQDEITEPDNNRYCTVNDYYDTATDITVKDYAVQNGIELLYFDYYEETEYCADLQYFLNGNEEVICLYEEIYDSDNALLQFYITDDRTEMDILQIEFSGFNQEAVINGVTVKYAVIDMGTYAKFEYKGYRYYLRVQDAPEVSNILTYVETLLS